MEQLEESRGRHGRGQRHRTGARASGSSPRGCASSPPTSRATALAETVDGLDGTSTFVADVGDFDDVAALADHAYATFGAVDVLCNNAGVFAGGFMWERPAADFAWTLGVNLWGILNGIRAFVPRMIAAGHAGAHREHRVDGRALHERVLRARTRSRSSRRSPRPSASRTTSRRSGAPIKVSAVVPGRGRHAHRRRRAATGPTPLAADAHRRRGVRRAGAQRPHARAGRAARRGRGADRRRDPTETVPRADASRATRNSSATAATRSSRSDLPPMPTFD